MRSRSTKKPILTLVLADDSNQSFAQALQPLFASAAAVENIKSNFLVTGFTMDEPPMHQFGNLINLQASGPNTKACLYFVVISHDYKVKLLKRIDLEGSQTSSEGVYNFLVDSKSLFDIMAEEDPQYAQVELL